MAELIGIIVQHSDQCTRTRIVGSFHSEPSRQKFKHALKCSHRSCSFCNGASMHSVLIWGLLLVAGAFHQDGRVCNFNNSDPNRDARCAAWAGLEPVAVQDPSVLKMLCYWPDPSVADPNKWQSVQVGRARVVSPKFWTSSNDTTHLPGYIRERLSSGPHLSCVGSTVCCFDGTGVSDKDITRV